MYTCPFVGIDSIFVNTDTENINLDRYVRDDVINIRIKVDSGVTLGSAAATSPALECTKTIDNSKSSIEIINDGYIYGCNGIGGDGKDLGDGDDGTDGGDAIVIEADLTIDNSNGYIFAGGGGGGGGAGGLGVVDGSGGGGYPGGDSGDNAYDGETEQYGAASGGSGDGDAVAGGDCVGPGEDGTNGDSYSIWSGGSGGSAGKAIDTNGNNVTWLGGNTPSRVKGAVT